jgi:hypothetical protein
MKPHGTYRLLGGRRSRDAAGPDPILGTAMRQQRIVDSLRCEISNSEHEHEIRIRQIFTNPREIFRIELEVPEMNYQRTTLLDRDALEELLEVDEIRALVREPID